MRSVILSALLAAAAVAAIAADSPSLTGNWKVHNNVAGNESDMTCSFSQKGTDLAGTCKGDQGASNITGKIDGKKVTWTYKSEYNGGPLTLTYSGNLEPSDKISGSVNVEEYSVEGDFTASK